MYRPPSVRQSPYARIHVRRQQTNPFAKVHVRQQTSFDRDFDYNGGHLPQQPSIPDSIHYSPSRPFTNMVLTNPPERSPSPTPSEMEEANQPFIPKNWYKKPKAWYFIFLALLIVVIAITFGVLHDKIAKDLRPLGTWLRARPYGWIIPIAIMVIISFPPLFGHELLALLIGDVYGLGIGFVIVAVGTLLGETLNFFVFRHLCLARGRKLERNSWFYACFSSAVRAGGIKIATLAFLSAIPGHLTTMVFATCRMNFSIFLFSAFLSLPKQLGAVSAGALLASSQTNQKSTKIPSLIFFSMTILATILAHHFIKRKIDQQRIVIVRERRRLRAASEKRFIRFRLGSESSQQKTSRGKEEDIDFWTTPPSRR